ncbi:MAG: hypothetical protein ACOCWB_04540 [Bacteroidota bacterium]
MGKIFIKIVLAILTVGNCLYAQQPSDANILNNLQTEIMLHPADASIRYVLKKGEFIYNQALTPYPNWAW